MTSPTEEERPTFLFSYRYKGSNWSFEFPTEDFADAEARLAAIHLNGKVDSILRGEIPAPLPGDGLLVRAIESLRNLLSS